ncbi:MAG: UDP-glucose 4-epimerase GalE [Clostridiales bacterium]|nr:UDP-glucose 4-epimerase GalE [Clostridiales bacterium]
MKNILITGGAGYIGSHTAVELFGAGYAPIVCDDFSNSKPDVLDRIETIAGKRPALIRGDLKDRAFVRNLFDTCAIDACIHFAGFKAVGESVAKPLEYYENNLFSALNVLNEMRARGIQKFIFSSSATVYGKAEQLPLTEDSPIGGTTNPYGATKLMIEDVLRDLAKSGPEWSLVILRYFNPVGAHESGLIGEDPQGIPNNLMPYVAKVAAGELPRVNVFGDDYPTPDGTGVRDYIHVVDLARGHIAALRALKKGLGTYNLGTGRGVSVLEIIKAFEKACGRKLPYQIAPRRPGDIAACWASPDKAWKELGWKAEKTLDEMCADHWNFQVKSKKER